MLTILRTQFDIRTFRQLPIIIVGILILHICPSVKYQLLVLYLPILQDNLSSTR